MVLIFNGAQVLVAVTRSLHSAAERLLAEAIIAALPAEAEDAQPAKKQKKAK